VSENTPVTKNTRSYQRLIHRSVAIFTVSGLLLLIVYLSLPYAASYGIKHWFQQQGIETAEIERVQLDIFKGQIQIRGLTTGAGSGLSIARMSLLTDWLPLLDNKVIFHDIDIQGANISVQKSDNGEIQIGPLWLKNLAKHNSSTQTSEALTVISDSLNITDSKVDFSQKKLKLAVSISNLTIGDFSNQQTEQSTPVRFTGTVNNAGISYSGAIKPLADIAQASGDIKLDKLALGDYMHLIDSMPYDVTTSLSGEFQFDASYDHKADAGKQLRQKIQGKLQLNKLVIVDNQNAIQLLSTDVLAIEGIHVEDASRFRANSVSADKLSLLHPVSNQKAATEQLYLTRTENVSLSDVAYVTDKALSIDSIVFKNTQSILHRHKNGKWELIDNYTRKAERKAESNTPPETPLAIKINDIRFIEETLISLDDESVSPALRSKLKLDTLSLSQFDTTSKDKPIKVVVAGKLDDYASINLQGNLLPFAEKTNADIKGSIKSLELTALSGYATEHLGYILQSGQLDTNINTLIKEDNIDGKIELSMNNLELKPGDKEKMKAMTEQISISLDTALSMLRDSNNNIKLNVPIKGNINDPAFDYSDAINQAIGKAVKKTAVSFVAYSLGPFGALIALGDLVAGASQSVNLKPVTFAPGESEFTAKDTEYLGYVGKFLNERPKIRINICGIAAPTDVIALTTPKVPSVTDDQLLDLARERANVIKGHLIEEYRIGADRLFVCSPSINKQADASPEVTLGF